MTIISHQSAFAIKHSQQLLSLLRLFKAIWKDLNKVGICAINAHLSDLILKTGIQGVWQDETLKFYRILDLRRELLLQKFVSLHIDLQLAHKRIFNIAILLELA